MGAHKVSIRRFINSLEELLDFYNSQVDSNLPDPTSKIIIQIGDPEPFEKDKEE